MWGCAWIVSAWNLYAQVDKMTLKLDEFYEFEVGGKK